MNLNHNETAKDSAPIPSVMLRSARAQMLFFAQEKKRLADRAREPAVRDYLIWTALCLPYCRQPIAAACPSGSADRFWTGLSIAPHADIATLSVQAWGFSVEDFEDLYIRLRTPSARPVIEHKAKARDWMATYTTPQQTPSLKDCLWIYPAKIEGTRINGEPFAFSPAIDYAKGLHVLLRLNKAPQIPEQNVITPRPAKSGYFL